jgi:hypothetical protein
MIQKKGQRVLTLSLSANNPLLPKSTRRRLTASCFFFLIFFKGTKNDNAGAPPRNQGSRD